jgi:hypothetical protein
MKNKLALTLIITLVSFGSVFAQYENNWAVGLKIGEPLGLNIRKYFSYGDRVFDVNIGSYGFLYGRERNYRKDQIYNEAGVMVFTNFIEVLVKVTNCMLIMDLEDR